ncbi:glycine zipper 2TM domain-containing protein [Rugosibacter aromaticivorans]|uniref:glycine zipper 2TM domain-containing protein n=1 Tax=Rugosibacter aromaticivorans TaxID=1565605 RepID=UPI000AD1D5B3|nr:glycine zipper 2TM domain-containing protein [Rugosibacter aromaticivorans]
MSIPKKMLLVPFALLILFPLALSSTIARAQQTAYPVAGPRIDGFDVEPARRLTAGNDLMFTLYGSPGGTAAVRINGVVDRFPLEEVEAGVYEATYTIKSRDRITAEAMVTANLRVGNRIATDILDESLLAGAASRSDAKRAADAAALAAVPRIDRFEVGPVGRLDSGTDLFFSLSGSPGGKASVRINGVKGKLSLKEVATGVYEGTYTIKDRDRISANSVTTATLRRSDQEASALLGQSLLAVAGHMPSARRATRICANCGVVELINVVEITGDGSYLGKIAGGVVGAMIGSQIGKGRGTAAAEIAGAVSGAVAGNEIEKRVKKTRHYDVTVRLQGGGIQTISYATEPALKVGDKVRVENGTLAPAS